MDLKNAVIIIESPNKIKKIREYTGARVIATVGHFKDLPKEELGIDLKTYQPTFKAVPGKARIQAELKALKGNTVYIASDPDREGYAIATHCHEAVKRGCGDVYRAEIREITPKGVMDAIRAAKPFLETNRGLYEAFLGRRVGDRLIGYILSPLASNSLNAVFSVGRVQSPGLRLIVEREEEIRRFEPTPYWTVELRLREAGQEFKAFYTAGDIKDLAMAERIMESIAGAESATVKAVESSVTKRNPKPPFTTSTLQQAACNRLDFGAEKTMELAQQLFEKGLISYHRTDSQRISPGFIKEIRNHIKRDIGPEYCPEKPNEYVSKNSQANAHEGTRPTHIHPLAETGKVVGEAELSESHEKLYRLIYARTLASQMKPVLIDTVKVALDCRGEEFKATGSVLRFEGFGKIYEGREKKDENENPKMPVLKEGQAVEIIDAKRNDKKTKPPARYTDATFVKELEKRGIGRPSTFASILKLIKDRKYAIVKEKQLWPTLEGERLIEYLKEAHPWVIDYDFTRAMESTLDQVEDRKADWKKFVWDLHAKVRFMEPPKFKFFGEKRNGDKKH